MRKYILYLFTFVFTFIFGVTAFYIIIVPIGFPVPAVKIPSDTEPIVFALVPKPRFANVGSGCGGSGSGEGYITDDDQHVSEGVTKFESREQAMHALREELLEATVVEHKVGYRNHRAEVGERYVLVADEPPYVTILFYDGSDYLRSINAPNEGLAREFEQYLISEKK